MEIVFLNVFKTYKLKNLKILFYNHLAKALGENKREPLKKKKKKKYDKTQI